MGKTIGIIGGMSWESTQEYYRIMNEYVRAKRGGHHSVEAIVYSVDFARILDWVERNDWEAVADDLARVAQALQKAGAGLIAIASNAAHKVFDAVEAKSGAPLLHIADPTGAALRAEGIRTVGLLGTKVTMEESFYKERLRERFGIEALIPEKEEREELHAIIFNELVFGRVESQSRSKILEMIERLQKEGAEAIILGCTELTLFLPLGTLVFDTTALHAKAAVDAALD